MFFVYEIQPTVWGRVGPDPQLQPQVDTAEGRRSESWADLRLQPTLIDGAGNVATVFEMLEILTV